MKIIVLTGGPCSGKSTIQKALAEKFSDRIIFVPEAATLLLNGGFPLPGRDLEWSLEWQAAFQSAITKLQQSMEEAHLLVARRREIKWLVCDRGIMDGAAYTPGGAREYCRRYGLEKRQIFARYKTILHLESLATADPDKFGKAGNEVRYETQEEARALELATRDAWIEHPHRVFIGGRESIEEKIAEAVNLINQEMAEEKK